MACKVRLATNPGKASPSSGRISDTDKAAAQSDDAGRGKQDPAAGESRVLMKEEEDDDDDLLASAGEKRPFPEVSGIR